jgi:hypothetical protein
VEFDSDQIPGLIRLADVRRVVEAISRVKRPHYLTKAVSWIPDLASLVRNDGCLS